jgi:hypothetical protein
MIVQFSNRALHFLKFFNPLDKAFVSSKEAKGFSDEATPTFFTSLASPLPENFSLAVRSDFLGLMPPTRPSSSPFPKKNLSGQGSAFYLGRWVMQGVISKIFLPFPTKTKPVEQVWIMLCTNCATNARP